VTPEVFSQSRVAQQQARVLRPGDEIEFGVEVNGIKEVPLSIVKLNYDGSILAPLIGDVDLDSLTLAQARTKLEKSYGKIFVAPPLITIRLPGDVAGEWGYVTVLGLVRNPGRLPVASIAGMNLSDALHGAGGFDQSANMQAVVVTRKASDGQLLQCECDITRLGRTGSGQYDLVLFDEDIVYVPERLF
jgi:protein involved in polysaccharide export with SLBB domain